MRFLMRVGATRLVALDQMAPTSSSILEEAKSLADSLNASVILSLLQRIKQEASKDYADGMMPNYIDLKCTYRDILRGARPYWADVMDLRHFDETSAIRRSAHANLKSLKVLRRHYRENIPLERWLP